jgi:hypothetical protein
MAMRTNSDNIALMPQFVDRYFSLAAVERMWIDPESGESSYQAANLDFAHSFDSDGRIEWKRQLPWRVTGPGRASKEKYLNQADPLGKADLLRA